MGAQIWCRAASRWLTVVSLTAGATACRGAKPSESPDLAPAEQAVAQHEAAVDRDAGEANLRHGCGQGSAEACYYLGALLLDTANPADALAPLNRACDDGMVLSCGLLGDMYTEGVGVDKDLSRGVAKYQTACDAGEVKGCVKVGFAHIHGAGAPKEPERGKELLRVPCEEGFADACSVLGDAHLSGLDGGSGREAAVHWYDKACELGSPSSCYNAGVIFYEGGQQRQGATAFGKSCAGGDHDGCAAVTMAYFEGHAEETELHHAREVLQEGCDGDVPQSCIHVARLYAEGIGVEADNDRAYTLLDRACRAGSAPACYALGSADR